MTDPSQLAQLADRLRADLQRTERERDEARAALDEFLSGRRTSSALLRGAAGLILRVFAGNDLHGTGRRAWDGWSRWLRNQTEDLPEAATRDFTISLIARLTRLGLVAMLFALVPSVLLVIQTVIFSRQTRIMELQTDHIARQNDMIAKQTDLIGAQGDLLASQNQLLDQQNQLAEASRRSALIFELTSILDQVEREVAAQEGRDLIDGAKEISRRQGAIPGTDVLGGGDPSKPELFTLSRRLENRIVTLSRALRPYRYLEYPLSAAGEAPVAALRPHPVSPERGQLLIALVENDVDMKRIAVRADFSFADLGDADVIHTDLSGIRLSRANLRGANFNGTSMAGGDLRWADLRGAHLNRTDLTGAYLAQATLEAANLQTAIFEGTQVDDPTWLDRHATELGDARADWKQEPGITGGEADKRILLRAVEPEEGHPSD